MDDIPEYSCVGNHMFPAFGRGLIESVGGNERLLLEAWM